MKVRHLMIAIIWGVAMLLAGYEVWSSIAKEGAADLAALALVLFMVGFGIMCITDPPSSS